ncbi:hypothetical protein Bca4012_006563 [Brassica carinata]
MGPSKRRISFHCFIGLSSEPASSSTYIELEADEIPKTAQEISSFAVVGRLTSGLLFLRSLSQRSASQNLRIKIGKINSGEQTSCRCDYFLQGPLVFSVTLCKTVIAKRERLILMVESTAASGVLHIFGQEVSYNFGHSPLRPP